MTKSQLEIPFTMYPRDGEFVAPHVSGVFENGLRHGAWKTTHENGTPEQEYHWELGIKHGPELDWHENGVHSCVGRNERGKRAGTWSWWYENGQHQEDNVHDEQGLQQGKYEWKSEAGVVEVTGQYLDGVKHGPWVYIATQKFERHECGFDRNRSHGKDIAWYPGGKLAHKRSWVRGDKHGEDEQYDTDGKPTFKGEWYLDIPVGTHITWEDGKETRTTFVHGIPEDVAGDAKLRAKVLKKLAKAKDSYAKSDALDEVEYAYRAAYLLHLWREGHYDAAGDPEVWDKLVEASAAMSGEELVRFLAKVKTKGLSGHLLPLWDRDLDKLVVAVYARDPEPIEAAFDRMKGPVRAGVAFVRARFGLDIGDELFDLMPKLVSQHVEHYGLSDLLWPDVEGVVRDVKLRGEGEARTPHFDLLVTWFGGYDAWVAEVRKLMLKQAKAKNRVYFRLCRDALELASPDEMAAVIKEISLDSDTQEQIRRALLDWRNDDVATTMKIALAIDDTGLNKWPAVAAAILAHRGAPIPDALADALTLETESPTYTSSWYTEPLSALPDEYRKSPPYRTAYIGTAINVAVPRMKLLREAMAALSPAQRKRLVDAALAGEYTRTSAAQYLYLFDDPALWERALDLLETETYGHGDSPMYGVGELGARIVPSLVARLERAKTKDWREGYRKALLVACARTIADGELPPTWDAHVDFELASEDAYAPFVERILCKLPVERAERLLVAALGAKDAATFATAFAMIAACPTRPVLEAAFTTLLGREAKLTSQQQRAVAQGIGTLNDARAYVAWILRSGGGGGLGDNLASAVGWNAFEEIQKELASSGVAKPTVIDAVEKLRMLAEDTGGKGERIYILRRLEPPDDDDDDDTKPVDDGTLNVVGGAPPGIGADRWPKHDDEPMAHLFTLDVKTMPELAKRVGDDVRAVSVFCWNPDNNEAFEPGNDRTAIVTSTEAQVAAKVTPPDDAPERRVYRFQPVAIEVSPKIWSEDGGELRKQIYVAGARVLGEPQWLQSDEGGGSESGFLMQFDEGFCSMNLGDSGIMYVYSDDAFWQCH